MQRAALHQQPAPGGNAADHGFGGLHPPLPADERGGGPSAPAAGAAAFGLWWWWRWRRKWRRRGNGRRRGAAFNRAALATPLLSSTGSARLIVLPELQLERLHTVSHFALRHVCQTVLMHAVLSRSGDHEYRLAQLGMPSKPFSLCQFYRIFGDRVLEEFAHSPDGR